MDWLTDYGALKWLHILSATFLFGTGVGSAFYKFMTDRGGDVAAIASTNRLVVLADWLFTLPTIVLQPITGVLLALAVGYPLSTAWLVAAIGLYIVAVLCWLPVVYLQIVMRNESAAAHAAGRPLGARYARHRHIWIGLGAAAFVAFVTVYALMIFKPPLW